MPSLSCNRRSQQDSEQGAIANAFGQRMLTSTLDFDFYYVSWICGGAGAVTGSCCLSQNNKLRPKKILKALENWSLCVQSIVHYFFQHNANVCGYIKNRILFLSNLSQYFFFPTPPMSQYFISCNWPKSIQMTKKAAHESMFHFHFVTCKETKKKAAIAAVRCSLTGRSLPLKRPPAFTFP